jgi:3-oxoacyl-[acyl-carrier-protein] synthase-3
MTQAVISAIAFHLPAEVLTNARLALDFPEWPADKIEAKTGILQRHIAGPAECSSDLAYNAARNLFAAGHCRPEEVDFVILCTQTPDFALPTTACMLQHRLGIPTTAGAFDFNLGCSGYVYGLSLCKGLVETGQARKVLLLTAETYSKLLDTQDKGARTIFGDGAAATLVTADNGTPLAIGPFVFGTDGRGATNLICAAGGFREKNVSLGKLSMNGPEIFNFTLKAVPETVNKLLHIAGLQLAEVDLFVFHQANQYMLEHLRRKLGVAEDRFFVSLADSGNTVSSTIPIALCRALEQKRLKPGMRIMLMGFGVGYSWAGAMIRWL